MIINYYCIVWVYIKDVTITPNLATTATVGYLVEWSKDPGWYCRAATADLVSTIGFYIFF